MKIRTTLTAAVVAVASLVTIGTSSATSVSAADLVTVMVDDYECYSASMISGYTSLDSTANPPTISMDTTTGANGTSNSMKVELVNGNVDYNFWRVVPEDNYLLCNQYYEMSQTGTTTDLYFTFWAKASTETTMTASLYIKTGLYYPSDFTCNLSTEWQQYAFKVTDAINQTEGSEGYQDTVLNNIINAVWATRADAYLQSITFSKASGFEGTIWIDQIAFTGTEFSMGSGDLPTDTFDESDYDVLHYCDTATHGATTTIMPAAGAATTTTTDDTTTTEESAVEEETSSEEEVASEEETSSEEEEEVSSTTSSKATSSAADEESGGLSTGAIVAIIIAIVVVVAAGVVGFIFYRKKAGASAEGEEATEDTTDGSEE